MARLDEIAEGIASILAASPTPEPLKIELKGEGQGETTFLVRAVVDSCKRRGVSLYIVCVGVDIGADLIKLYQGQSSGYQGVALKGSDILGLEVEFYRFPHKTA